MQCKACPWLKWKEIETAFVLSFFLTQWLIFCLLTSIIPAKSQIDRRGDVSWLAVLNSRWNFCLVSRGFTTQLDYLVFVIVGSYNSNWNWNSINCPALMCVQNLVSFWACLGGQIWVKSGIHVIIMTMKNNKQYNYSTWLTGSVPKNTTTCNNVANKNLYGLICYTDFSDL